MTSRIVEILALIISITALALSGIYAVTWQQNQHDKLVSDAIRVASERGVDPMAVRCAFADSKDTICLVYSAGVRDGSKDPKPSKK